MPNTKINEYLHINNKHLSVLEENVKCWVRFCNKQDNGTKRKRKHDKTNYVKIIYNKRQH